MTILLIYVNDILITGNNSSHIFELIPGEIVFLRRIQDLCIFFLGLEAVYSSNGLFLTQTKYTMDQLYHTKFQGVKPISSPAHTRQKLSLYDGDPLLDHTKYLSVVGVLHYLICLDISFVVNQVC